MVTGRQDAASERRDDVANHIKGILNGGFGLIQGMGLTLKHLFEPPITVQYPTRSATVNPGAKNSTACRFENEGARHLIRYGCSVPSLTMKTPRSPRGDSTWAYTWAPSGGLRRRGSLAATGPLRGYPSRACRTILMLSSISLMRTV